MKKEMSEFTVGAVAFEDGHVAAAVSTGGYTGKLPGRVGDSPIVGAGFYLLLHETFSRLFTQYYLIPVGLIFIAMVIFMPQGLLGFMRRWLNR